MEKENEVKFTEKEIVRFHEVKQEIKPLEKEKDELAGLFKSALHVGEEVTTPEGYWVKKSQQERTSMNSAELLNILKKLGHTEAIRTVEIADESAVQDLIFQGKLTPEDIAPAVNVNLVEMVKSGKRKPAAPKKGKPAPKKVDVY